MDFDCVVLAGGRSSRLGGHSKSTLTVAGRSLLQLTLDAAADARQTVIVGDTVALASPSSSRVMFAREEPAFGGPAAAIAAGIAALGGAHRVPAEFTLVLACDMPNIARAVRALLREREPGPQEERDGVVAVDSSGHPQYLAGLYRTRALTAAIGGSRNYPPTLSGLAVHTLMAPLELTRITVDAGATDDVDTWADAARLHIDTDSSPDSPGTSAPVSSGSGSAPASSRRRSMNAEHHDAQPDAAAEKEKLRLLEAWATALATALDLDLALDLAGDTPNSARSPLDIELLLSLAGTAAHAVTRPAAPLTTFFVGYSAGRAAANGTDPAAALEAAADTARELTTSWNRPNDAPRS